MANELQDVTTSLINMNAMPILSKANKTPDEERTTTMKMAMAPTTYLESRKHGKVHPIFQIVLGFCQRKDIDYQR